MRLRGRDPPGEIRSEILPLGAVPRSQMVLRRPIWGQKGVIWGPLGFRAQPAHPWAQNLALAWLACLLCPALAWSGLGLSCLPCQQQQRAAFGGQLLLNQEGKAGKTGLGQTKPRQGTTGKPAKPKQDFGTQGAPRGPMGLPWDFHGAPMGAPWAPHGAPRGPLGCP